MEEMRLIIFKLGEERYGLDVGLVRAIEKVQPIVRIPNSVPYIKGVMNLRGKVIPVCSLRQKFSMPELQNTNDTKFLVTVVNRMEVALIVDEVVGIFDIARGSTHEPPQIALNEETSYLEAIVDSEGRLVLVLDSDNLLTQEEQGHVQQMMKDQ